MRAQHARAYVVAPWDAHASPQHHLARDSFRAAKRTRAAGEQQERALVLTNCRLLDVQARTCSSSPDHTVVLHRGLITAVDLPLPSTLSESVIVDCGGMVLMPGLCDAHVHCTAVSANLPGLLALPESLVTARAVDVLEGMLERGFTTVLGATNYSHWPGSGGLRRCLVSDPPSAAAMLEFAKRRLASFAHVGTTERLNDSFEAAAAVLGMPLVGRAYGGGENTAADVEAAGRPVSWDEAMARGAAPRPPHQDDLYDDSGGGSGEDIHQLAADVRAARARVAAAKRRWNAALGEGAQQAQLRRMRAELLQLQADAAAAQDALVEARRAVARARREAAQGNKEKVLDMALGVEVQRCAVKAQNKNGARRKTSLINLRLPDGRPVDFNRGSRGAIPADVIQDIQRLNALDVELHRLGVELLEARRRDASADGRLQRLPQVMAQDDAAPEAAAKKDELR